ncbi:MAG: hypothetical protein IKB72_05695 [Ruminococcus sp.]|nr:hypothetical protein [Ruminococcus sp.]
MKRIIKWFFMLNKRLFKKASFVIILALIPLCIGLFTSVAQKEKGFLHIILVQTDETDAVSEDIINKLTSIPSVIRFSKSSSPQEATEAVSTGKADEAWIFPSDTKGRIDAYVKYGADKFITVISREKTVFSMLSREKLSSAVFEYTAKAYYLDFARAEYEGLDKLNDEELMEYFENVSIDEELFVFSNPASSDTQDESGAVNYLTTPIRGLLGTLIMICGMASALYLMKDEQNGTFSWASDRSKLPIGFASMFIAVLNISVVAVISLTVSKLNTALARELLVTFLYCICCTIFCMLLKLIISNMKLFAVIVPLVSIISMAVCPVFYNTHLTFQLFLPPTYYVNATYQDNYIIYMGLYTLLCFALCMLICFLKNIRTKHFR